MENLTESLWTTDTITGLQTCRLKKLAREMGWPRCGSSLHWHHFWNTKGASGRVAKAVTHVVEELYPHIFLWQVCDVHNVDRYADTESARRSFMRQALKIHPIEHLREAFTELQNCYIANYKPVPHQLRLERYL